MTFQSANSYTGGTIINGGTLKLSGAGTLGSSSNSLTVNGGTLDLGGSTQTASGGVAQTGGAIQNGWMLTTIYQMTGGTLASTVTLNASALFDLQAGTVNGVLTGPGALSKTTSGTVTLTGANTYSGNTTVNAGTLVLSGAGTLGDQANSLTVNGGTLDLGGTSQVQNGGVTLTGGAIADGTLATMGTFNVQAGTVSADLAGAGALVKNGAGKVILAGTNAYTGGTTVNAGTLEVDGAIGTSVTVNGGGTLAGSGTVGNTLVNSGGTFAPGNGTAGTSTLVAGNLAFASGATYLVQLNSSAASLASVTGGAILGGATVNASFASGNVAKQYTILTAASGVSGTFAPTVAGNLSGNFRTSLSYDATSVYLNLALDFGSQGALNGNQQAVGNALTNVFNTNGSISGIYGSLTKSGLTQASGELATAAQQTTIDAMSQFIGLLTDPSLARSGGAAGAGGAPGFAEEEGASAAGSSKRSDAFAAFAKSPAPTSFGQRWSVWAAGFGGSQSTEGNAAAGSNTTTSRIYGTAVGAEYLVSPTMIAGFALAGGGTNFSVTGSGGGRSDLFQAGAYVRHANGPGYVSAALAYGWQDLTTDRTITIAGADRLRAEFNANAWSGRLEAGYRVVAPWSGGIGITPYAAAQATTFGLPEYAEQVVSGASSFALSYAAKWTTDTRTELGLRTDKSLVLQDGVFALRGRLAWAHDDSQDRSIAATFQALPGASFVVNGAAMAADSALATASAEMTWTNGWSAAATFEGSLSQTTRSYAGRGAVRYQW